jgi:hypothetical protein
MPEFETYVDVDVDEFISVCSKREIRRLIECLVEEDYLPKSVLTFKEVSNERLGRFESDFIEKLDLLKEKYYSLSVEEEDSIEKIFKKHL